MLKTCISTMEIKRFAMIYSTQEEETLSLRYLQAGCNNSDIGGKIPTLSTMASSEFILFPGLDLLLEGLHQGKPVCRQPRKQQRKEPLLVE